MPEAFPDFDKKPPERASADPDGSTPGESGQESGTGPDPWKVADLHDDPYVDPYHAGATGSGSGHPAPGPTPDRSDTPPDPLAEEPRAFDGTGLAGVMRRWAAAGAEDEHPRRTVLELADHVEAVESRVGGVLGRPLRDRGLDGLARRVERNPLAAIAGALLAGWVVNRMLD